MPKRVPRASGGGPAMIEFRNGGVVLRYRAGAGNWLVLVIALVSDTADVVESSNSGVCARSSAWVIVTLDGAEPRVITLCEHPALQRSRWVGVERCGRNALGRQHLVAYQLPRLQQRAGFGLPSPNLDLDIAASGIQANQGRQFSLGCDRPGREFDRDRYSDRCCLGRRRIEHIPDANTSRHCASFAR